MASFKVLFIIFTTTIYRKAHWENAGNCAVIQNNEFKHINCQPKEGRFYTTGKKEKKKKSLGYAVLINRRLER